MADMTTAVLILSILPIALVIAALSDLLTMTIPNRICAVAVIAFLMLAPLSGLTWPVIGMNLLAGLLVFGVCFALFACNVMGGGDAKLLTAVAVWFGFHYSLLFFLVTVTFAGFGLTILFLLLRWQASAVLAMGIPLPASVVGENKIPYGIAIAIGGCLSFSTTPIAALALHTIG